MMKILNDKLVLTTIIMIVILLVLALYGYLSDGWEAWGQSRSKREPAPAIVEWECVLSTAIKGQMRTTMLNGIDEALKSRVIKLFEVWMADTTADQPKRAAIGLQNATKAYQFSRRQIEAWDPPVCP